MGGGGGGGGGRGGADQHQYLVQGELVLAQRVQGDLVGANQTEVTGASSAPGGQARGWMRQKRRSCSAFKQAHLNYDSWKESNHSTSY